MKYVADPADPANFTQFHMPLVRKVYPRLIADNLVGVQPMSKPISSIFYTTYMAKFKTDMSKIYPLIKEELEKLSVRILDDNFGYGTNVFIPKELNAEAIAKKVNLALTPNGIVIALRAIASDHNWSVPTKISLPNKVGFTAFQNHVAHEVKIIQSRLWTDVEHGFYTTLLSIKPINNIGIINDGDSGVRITYNSYKICYVLINDDTVEVRLNAVFMDKAKGPSIGLGGTVKIHLGDPKLFTKLFEAIAAGVAYHANAPDEIRELLLRGQELSC